MREVSTAENGGNENQVPPKGMQGKWRVHIGRAVVALLIAAVVFTTYKLLNAQENRNFETAFAQFARTLGDAAVARQEHLQASLKAMSNSISVYGATGAETWPFVTMPMFEILAEDFKAISRAEYVGVSNTVHHKDRESFVNYTTSHYKEWIQGSHMMAYGNLDKLNQDPSKLNKFVSAKINGTFVKDIDRDVYYVRTSTSPPPLAYGPLLNWNIASTHNEFIMNQHITKLPGETIMGNVRPFKALPPSEHQGFHKNNDATHPHTFVYHNIPREPDNYNSEIVSTIVAVIAWDVPMLNLLPHNVNGLRATITNNCNQSYTYEIHGEDADYMGEGALYDDEYADMKVTVDLSLHISPDFEKVEGHCMYEMHIYPTKQFRDSYNSSTPERFTVVVATTFTVVALAFFIYDHFMARKNQQLAKSAARSNAVVTDLFPQEFREQILEQHDIESPSNKKPKRFSEIHQTGHDDKRVSKIYDNTTIMFADMVGFTSWCTNRPADQIFALLEAVYAAFDEAAVRRNIFKVETVGDCYVAVAGLPNPQSTHAVIMAEFARECLEQMDAATKELSSQLGSDITNLQMRIGLHSGSVVGGVLRGQKTRFQLFGDAMNTASRLETNGTAGRIHVSQQTARALHLKGKMHWLVPREDKIVAKGKGELQTYWLT